MFEMEIIVIVKIIVKHSLQLERGHDKNDIFYKFYLLNAAT